MSIIHRNSKYYDFYRHITENEVPGIETVYEFGKNTSFGQETITLQETGGEYHWLESAVYLHIVSDSAEDTADGTGAREVRIKGLDANFEKQTEDVVTNGTTEVETANQYLRINQVRVIDVGSHKTNVGQIDVQDQESSPNITHSIMPDQGRTHTAVYTVPAGYTGYFIGWYGAEKSNQGVDFQLWTRNTTKRIWQLYRETVLSGIEFERQFPMPIRLPETTDGEIKVKGYNAGTAATGGFQGYIESNKISKYF